MIPAWQWSDIAASSIVGGLITLFFAWGVWDIFKDIWLRLRNHQPFALRKLLFALVMLPMTIGMGWGAYSASNRNRLLRGEKRYTVITVVANHYFKGGKVSYYEYQVNGVRYEDQQEVDFLGHYRPLGSRWFLRFSVADPEVHEPPGPPVPDTLTHIPPAGWVTQPPAFPPNPDLAPTSDSLPTPTRPAPTSRPAPSDSAAKPAPTHPNSPLFLKSATDSTAKSPTPQAHPFLPQVSPRRP